MTALNRSTVERSPADTGRNESFVGTFAEYWTHPDIEGLRDILTDDVCLYQPLSPPTDGLAESQRAFAKLLNWLPDLHAEVERWSGDGDTVFIEFRLIATIARKPYAWDVVDRFTLRGDKACVRVSYFDALPLSIHILSHPSAWWGWFRSGVARPWA